MASTEDFVTGTRGSGSPIDGDYRSSDEIRRSIERQRDDLDVTAEVLEHKLAPRELAEQLWNDMRTRVSSGAGDMVGVVKRHPVPFGLIGAGIAWWLYESSSGRGLSFGNGARRYEHEADRYEFETEESWRQRSMQAAQRSAERVRSGAQRSAEAVRSGAQRSAEAVRSSAEAVRSGAHQAREGFSEAVDRNPLALGAACFSLGLLAAIAVPSSRWENATLGETRDRVTRRAREAAKRAAVGAAEQGARVAHDAAERLKDEAERSPSDYGEARKSSRQDGAGGSGLGGDVSDPWDPNRPSS